MACQVPSVEPSSTRISSNVMPVASRTSAIARCSAGILPSSFIAGTTTLNRGASARWSLAATSARSTFDSTSGSSASPSCCSGACRVVWLFQSNHVPDRGRHSPATTRIMRSRRHSHQEPSPREGKVPAGAADITGEGISGIVGWVRLSLRPVDRRARRPAAGTTARRSLGAACLALACAMLVELRRRTDDWCLLPDPSPQVDRLSHRPVAAATPVGTAVAPRFGEIVWATATDPVTNAPDRARLQLPSGRSAHHRRGANIMRSPPDRPSRQPGSTTTPLSTRSPPASHRPKAAPRMDELLYRT